MLKGKERTENDEILDELEKIRERLNKNETLFNMAEEDEIIDAIIFEQRSLQSRYAYLLKKAKENGIKADYTDRL